MKKHALISILIILLVIVSPKISRAAFIPKTMSFGGKVITAQFKAVDCIGVGQGPVVLLQNIQSLTSVPSSNAARGLYGAIPYYAKLRFTSQYPFVSPLPKDGDLILGRADTVPNVGTCLIHGTPIPFPVRDTNNYSTSSTYYKDNGQ